MVKQLIRLDMALARKNMEKAAEHYQKPVAVRKRLIPKRFTGSDLIKIGIKKGTAWTFPYKHRIDRGKGYETFRKYFRQNPDKTYSLLENS